MENKKIALVEVNGVGIKNQICDVLNEDTNQHEKQFFIAGIFTVAGKRNRNGRVYPSDICESAIQLYNDEYIKTRTAYGEIMHPETLTVNLSKTAIIVESYKKESDGVTYTGRAKILSTPEGEILKSLIRDNCAFGVSTRGEGAVESMNEGFKVMSWEIMAVDVVGTPSVREAMMEKLIENKLNNFFHENQIKDFKNVSDKIVRETFDKAEKLKKFDLLVSQMFSSINKQE